MSRKIVRTTLVITAGPSMEAGRGADWYVREHLDHEPGEEKLVITHKSGGTNRGPQSLTRAAWLGWIRDQLVGELPGFRIRWSESEEKPSGYSDGNTWHNGIEITVPATRARRPNE